MRKSRNVSWSERSLSGSIHIKYILNHGCLSSGPPLHISVTFVPSVCERCVYVVISEHLKLSAGKHILFWNKGSHYVLSYFFFFFFCPALFICFSVKCRRLLILFPEWLRRWNHHISLWWVRQTFPCSSMTVITRPSLEVESPASRLRPDKKKKEE